MEGENSSLAVGSDFHLAPKATFGYIVAVSTASITMYSTSWCGYCKRLKRQLDDIGIAYSEINIEEVEGAAAIVEAANGGNQTVPTLVFSDGSTLTNPSAVQVRDKLSTLSA